jgi:DNA ligase-1
MIDAVAEAAALPLAAVRRAAMLSGNLTEVGTAALADGAAGLDRFRLQLFTPLQPMLAQPASDASEALDALGEAALEYKLDGVRVQVHKLDDEVRIYTRRLHEITDRVPELVEAVRGYPARRLILDGEALAFRADGRPQPFQVSMRRLGRKLDVAATRATLPLQAWYFDCLHVDGEDLIDRGARERHQALSEVITAPARVPRSVTTDPAEAQRFLDRAIDAGHEGIMAKSLDAPYSAGSRGADWLKIKPVQTLDLVVLAAEWGSGRRRGLLSNLHLGARDPGSGGLVMLGKTFKGLTDKMLEWQTRRLLELEIGREDHIVHVRPELVVEIAFNELQASPQYPGGLALRFARVRRYRNDKRAADADSIQTVTALFRRQRGADV